MSGIKNPLVFLLVEVGKVGSRNLERHRLCLSRSEAHLVERLEFLHRTVEDRIMLTHIDLHYFLSLTGTDILHLHRSLQHSLDRDSFARLEIAVLKLRVAQSVSEGEKRLDVAVLEPTVADIDTLFIFHIRAACVRAESVGRRVLNFHREGERKFSARVDSAEYHVSDGVSGLRAAEPALKNRRD